MLKQTLAIGLTQTIAWASSTYLPAILAVPIAQALGVTPAIVFGAFSASLVVMALAGPPVGRAIDRHGGRGILAASNVVLALGLVWLSFTRGAVDLYLAWGVLGLGMALGLYDAAFATLVRLHGARARLPITGITLIAGFASTVGWPLTAYLAAHGGWRTACIAWAAIHLIVALPINLLLIPAAGAPEEPRRAMPSSEERKAQAAAMPLLVAFAATTAFVTSAMAAHLPGLLVAMGASGVVAVGAASLLGPAQVAARILEIAAARR